MNEFGTIQQGRQPDGTSWPLPVMSFYKEGGIWIRKGVREVVSLQLLQVKNYFPPLNLWLTDEGVSDVFHDDGRCFALIGKDEHEP